jgi:peptidoglycan/xylan/chitin deacetylase (PgdA/CDA1 family)
VQGAVAERYPTLIRDIAGDGHAICAHGWDTDSLHYSGLDAAVERKYIADTLDALERASGKRPTGWISPARAESFATPDYLAEAGLSWCGDWAHDDLPTDLRTTGKPLVALPLSNELDDWQILIEYKRPETEWALQVADAAAVLRSEANRFGPQILSMTVRPYVTGQPYRVAIFRDSLKAALAVAEARAVTADEIVDAATG